MTAPVTAKRIATASETLENAPAAAVACRLAGLPYFAACALLEQESRGKNIYGHDAGGAFNVKGELEVTDVNFMLFLTRVFSGTTSNGVGPCQITYRGYFSQMLERGMNPADPTDNMTFGFELLATNYARLGSWEKAGAAYNGGPRPNAAALAYGRSLAAKVAAWKTRLGIK